MKTLLFFLLTLILLAAQPAATTYQVSPAASRITWTGYAEVGSYAPTGTVLLRRGTFEYDGRVPRNGRFEFAMRTLAQEQAQLAEHLRGPDFFDAEKFPTAVFELQDVRQGTARGRLTLHGVTRPVEFPLRVEGQSGGRLRITGTATLDRTQFGVNHNSSSFFQNLGSYAIRNDFRLMFDVVATKNRAE